VASWEPQPTLDKRDQTWVFNPPPGWPVPSHGWQPPAGWQPSPSWPPAPEGWEFWRPTTSVARNGTGFSSSGNELHLTFEGRLSVFRRGQTVHIGRGPGNDVVVGDPSVSRRHAQLSCINGSWIFENVGQAPTFLRGKSTARVAIDEAVELALGSAQGPVLRIEPALGVQLPATARVPAPQTATEVLPGQGAGRAVAGSPAASPAGMAPPSAAPPPVALPPSAAPWPAPPPPGAPQSGSKLATAFRILVPVGSWLTNPGWRQGLRLLVITYALLPLVFIALFASSGNLTTPGWTYSLYVAPLWAIGFWLLIRPGPIKGREVRIGIWVIAWTLAYLHIVTIPINDHLGNPKQFATAIAVGYNEELTKALPLMIAGFFLLTVRKVKLDVRAWMFFGTIAGLTFGAAETALYTPLYILHINEATPTTASLAVSSVLAFAERVFVDGFQHAIWAGISGFFIGMGLKYHRRRWWLIILGVSIPAILHALNDWSLGALNSYWAWILVQAVSLFLFIGYTMSAASIESEVRRTPIFRGDSMMMEALSKPGDKGHP
jgi:RsiW-degrading membrane proteinase PrsW (M82 family)